MVKKRSIRQIAQVDVFRIKERVWGKSLSYNDRTGKRVATPSPIGFLRNLNKKPCARRKAVVLALQLPRSMLELHAQGLAKHFGGPLLFEDVSLRLQQGQSLALTGPNGSGKSTLLQILWGFQRPTKGQVQLLDKGKALEREERPFRAAFSAPYLGLPEYMTGRAILDFHFEKRAGRVSVETMLAETGLTRVADKAVRHYSSGQRQRVRLALALYAEAGALFLDEPCTNLDVAGIELYQHLVQARLAESIVVVASNLEEEMRFVQARLLIAPPVSAS